MLSVNTHNDWDPLKEIIVGSAENYTSHDRELSFDVFFHENLFRSDWAYPRLKSATEFDTSSRSWKIKEKYVQELSEDVENLAGLLQSLGVVVHRPMTLPPDSNFISGFGWQAPPVPALNIRDNTLIVGNRIIETPPAIRSRYLETRLLSPIFNEYFKRGAEWATMPRPILTDRSFDLSYARDTESTLGGPSEPIENPKESPFDLGYEMILDGAQCLRLGKDIIINVANENHRLAVEWLKRYLEPEYTIHTVYRMSDNHIDSMLLALCPGVFLARHPDIKKMMPKKFQSWKYIVPPEPDRNSFPQYNDDDLVLTSPYIDLNVLSISPERVLVNESCIGLIRELEKNGFETIPVKHRHRRLFGGGFHCFTLDTVREGTIEDYS
ncbi:hypothetical protein [Rothia sp. CCM 9416]|uniref:hypothetical protein n=1 Tax=Rothia sp. CCM 9416 TaxID=3402655 RepID=UPI003AEEBBD8